MFPTCPSCKQSVLDDDPVTCPFCGASMSAKPGAKPSAPAKAAAVAPQRAPARPAPVVPASSSPFSSDPSPLDLGDDFGPEAIAISPKRTKARTWEIKCPMCETVGYVSPDASGKSVKCSNPKCMIPVFTAPRFQIEKPEAPKPVKRKSNIAGVAGVTFALMAIGGGLAWWIASLPNKTQLRGPSEEDLELIKQAGAPQPKIEKTADQPPKTPDKAPVADAKAQPKDKAPSEESFAAILKMLNDASLQKGQNRSKPYCRRMTAEAFALTGNLAGARKQLDALTNVGKELLYYKVSPLAEIAWQQLAGNQRKAAAKTADEALAAAEKLPKTGRDRLETAMSLAAVLVATNRSADALKVLDAHDTSEDISQLACAHQAVQALATFDLAEFHTRRPALTWNSPLIVGVVFELVGHQQSDAARKWIDKLPNARDRAEAMATWAEAEVWQSNLRSQEIPLEELRAAAAALPAPGDVLVLSRLGVGLSFAGQQRAAEDCLKQAAEKAAAWDAHPEIELPEDLKELSTFEAPNFDERSFQVAAGAELTHLAARLGQTEQSDALLSSTLARARALAPSRQDVQQRRTQILAGGIAALRDRLKTEWKLSTKEKAQAAATTIQKNLDELETAAEGRYDLQLALLSRAVDWGQAAAVWDYVRGGSTAANSAEADELLRSSLPSLAAEQFHAAGDKERLEAVTAAVKQQSPDKPLARPWTVLLREALESKPPNYDDVNSLLNKFNGDPAELDGDVLRAACRLAASKKIAVALDFTEQLSDMDLKEECYVLIAGLAGRLDQTSAVEKHLKELAQASEKVAVGRGLIAGLVARKAASTDDAGN